MNENELTAAIQSDWLLLVLTALVIVAATALLASLSTRFIKKLLDKEDVLPSTSIFVNLTRAGVWIAGICILLNTCFSIDVSAVIAALGVGGIALSLGFQDTISNLIGGLQVSLNKIVEPGDCIEVNDKKGIVKDVTWRHTTMKTDEGNEIIIPNAVINKQPIIRYSPQSQHKGSEQ